MNAHWRCACVALLALAVTAPAAAQSPPSLIYIHAGALLDRLGEALALTPTEPSALDDVDTPEDLRKLGA